MKDSFNERFGISSLTRSHDSLLMWAHYGHIMNILSKPCYHHVSLHQAFLNKIDYSLSFEQITRV